MVGNDGFVYHRDRNAFPGDTGFMQRLESQTKVLAEDMTWSGEVSEAFLRRGPLCAG